jgi:hypothetical protein
MSTTINTLTKLQKESLVYIKEKRGDVPKYHGSNCRTLKKKGLISVIDDLSNRTSKTTLTDLGNSIYFQI